MPSVEKRGSKWSVRFVVKDEFGKIIGQKRKSGFATKAEAMAAAADLEKASEKGIDIHGDSSTCGQIMEEWFNHKTKSGDIEETTLVKYSSYIDRLESTPIYNTPIRKIGKNALSDLIRSIRNDSGVSIRSAVCYTEPLRFALKWAVETGRIMSNPLQSQRLPKVPKRPQVILTDRDISDLIEGVVGSSHVATIRRILVFQGFSIFRFGGQVKRSDFWATKWASERGPWKSFPNREKKFRNEKKVFGEGESLQPIGKAIVRMATLLGKFSL